MNSNEHKKTECNCVEAGCFCDKVQYNEAENWEVNQLQNHLQQCPKCRDYSEKNSKLTLLIHKAELNTLSLEDRKQIKEELKKALQRKSNR